MKKIAAFAAFGVVLVGGICLLRVARLPAPTADGPAAAPIAVDEAGAAQRLAGALRIPTISHEDRSRNNPRALAQFAEYLRASFPLAHRALKREFVGPSLLFTWKGQDPVGAPILLLAHMDVVPVEPGTEDKWTYPPFDGVFAEGFVWGRGARDNKSGVLGLLEAVEFLLAEGFQPPRDVLLAFGHDEEIGGSQGARRIGELLKSRGVRAEFLLDEGGAVLDGIVAGVERPVAAIMAAEKGYFTVKLMTRAEGGHSSLPPPQTAVGQLARAVARVQEHPLPLRFERPVTDMLDRLAPEMPFVQKLALANRWLFAPLLLRTLAGDATTNTLVRTTTAPTVIHAGIKDNVLPSEAYALVNFRLLPGDTTAGVLAHVRRVVGDPGVEVRPGDSFISEPSTPSRLDNAAYPLLAQAARETFPTAVLSTGLVSGATDARNYAGVFEARYNFSPTILRPEDLATIHGTDERIAVSSHANAIRFYVRLLRNWGRNAVPTPVDS